MVSRKKEADEEEVPPQGHQKETPKEVVPEKPQQDPMQIITQLATVIQEQQKKIEQLETNLNSIMEYLKAQSQQSQGQGGIMEALVPLLGKLMEPAKDPLRDIALELMVESMKSNVELSKAITQRIVQGVQEKVAKNVVENIATGVITHE